MTDQSVADARAVLVLAFASAATALAAWLVPASVHVVGWDGDRVSLVSLLPPLSRLGLIMGVVLALALVLGVVAHRRQRLPRLARVIAPLTLLLLWVLPFVSILPERFPLLLVLGGPLRWVVLALAGLGCALTAAAGRQGTPAILWPDSRAVFVASLVVFIALGVHTKRVLGLGGDEPHYLIVAHSLLVDGDLRIENNHQERQYEGFYPGFCIAPGFLDSGWTVFASRLPRPARRGRVVPERGFGSRISPASSARCTSA